MDIFFWLTTKALKGFFHLFYHYQVYLHTPLYPKGAIIAPNHSSFLDPPLIGASWPEETHYLARSSLFNYWFLRILLKNLHAHPIQGSVQDHSSFKIIRQLVSQGKKVVIFPEGNRSEDAKLQPIKTGVAMLALHMHCPIIPTYIHGTYEAWPRHNRWPQLRLWARPKISITCVFGAPIFAESYLHLDKKEARQAMSNQLEQSIEKLRVWYEQGAQGELPH